MDLLVEWVWFVVDLFMAVPLVPLAISVGLLWPLTRGRVPRSRRLLVGFLGGTWLVYAVYESAIFVYGMLSGNWFVRNDMILIGPVLLGFAVLCLMLTWIKPRVAANEN
ncbi:MAG: hypothetical protein AAGF61_04520 [Pseudomonadota bacterium]